MEAAGQRRSQDWQLGLLIDAVVDYAIFLLDSEGRVLTWNAGAERIKGYAPEEIIGRHFSTFYTDEDRERKHPEHELEVALREGRFEEEGWRVRKDGTQFWANVVITTVYDPDGRHLGFGKVTRDLTARRLVETELHANAAELIHANQELDQFRRLVGSVRDYAIFMLDPQGNVATWNTGAERIKGYTASEIVGRHFSEFYTDPDRERRHPDHELEIALRDGRFEEEGWRVRKDGTQFWANVTITAVRDDDGVLHGFAKVTRDLSARREAEQTLRAANEELDRFASVAAHDLNDPLRTIVGFAELLDREQLSPQGEEFLGYIRRTAERMQGLLGGLLEFARAGVAGQPATAVELPTALDHVLASLAGPVKERNAEVAVSMPSSALVRASEADVELVLQNLISNALKFGDAARPRVEIAAEPVEEGWRITVADNGQGIGEEDQHRIFEAFERAHPELSRDGSGLGLAICERLVRRHGGSIGVDSQPGQGSRFWVLLPSPVATA